MSRQASPWSLCACFCVFKSLINTVSPLRLDSLSRCCVSMPDRYEKAHRSRPVRVCYTIDPDQTGWTDFLILFWTYSIFRSTLLSYINDFALVCMSVIAPCFIPLPEFYFDFLWIKKKIILSGWLWLRRYSSSCTNWKVSSLIPAPVNPEFLPNAFTEVWKLDRKKDRQKKAPGWMRRVV